MPPDSSAVPGIQRQQRLDLGCAGETLLVEPIVQRLLPEMIARSKQASLFRVPKREREHAAKVIEQTIAIALVQGDDDLAIAIRQKSMTTCSRSATQLPIVVDLAVATS